MWWLPFQAQIYAPTTIYLEAHRGFDLFHRKVVSGDFDRVLIRPWDTFFQVLADEFPLRRLGRLEAGGAGPGLQASVPWGCVGPGSKALYLAVVLVSGCAFYLAVIIAQGTMCFCTVQAVEFANIFTYGGTEMASYPLEIYADWFRKIFIFVVPLLLCQLLPLGRSLSASYSLVRAVDDVSFQIKGGELVGYIGPNGAGKSTTIKMLTGILVPTSGQGMIDGRVPHQAVERARPSHRRGLRSSAPTCGGTCPPSSPSTCCGTCTASLPTGTGPISTSSAIPIAPSAICWTWRGS